MMKTIKIFWIGLLTLLISCSQSNKVTDISERENSSQIEPMTEMKILENVKLAINPNFQDWVLFKNGTYVIFDNAESISDIREEAIKQMKEFGPVHGGGPAGDFSVTHLNKTEGWVVSGHGYGMYTYVNPNELDSKTPTDIEIGLYGRSKRNEDGEKPIILHVNRKE